MVVKPEIKGPSLADRVGLALLLGVLVLATAPSMLRRPVRWAPSAAGSPELLAP